MSGKRLRGVAVVVAMLAAAFLSAEAKAAPPVGVNSLTPDPGNSATPFTLTPPAGAACTGSGTGTPDYRWQTYMVSASVDASTLSYSNGPSPVTGALVSPLFDSTNGTPVVDQLPADSPVGLITGIPTFTFGPLVGSGIAAGVYKLGFACTQAGALDTGLYWEAPITISNVTSTSFDYVFGAVPSAPVLASPLTVGYGSVSGSFAALPSVPPISGYTVTATPVSGTDPVVTAPVDPGAAAFNLTGLVNGTTYDVTVTATNGIGTSAPSNTVSALVNPPNYAPVTGLTVTSAVGLLAVGWVAPSGDVSRTGYTIEVSPPVTGSPFTVGPDATSFPITGVANGVAYTVTVTATYPVPYAGTTATATTSYQGPDGAAAGSISVVRPVGALVLTQRCGVYGPLPALPPSLGFPALPALEPSVDQIGTPPLTDLGEADPVFADYPYPAVPTYPTHCGVDMGIGQLVTSGWYAGQYFSAVGRLNQVTVVDTRDTDQGFTVSGTASQFVGPTSQFSGNFLGWYPQVTSDSGPNLDGYDQTVLPGPPVTAVGTASTAGLATPKPFAYAVPGKGLGIATLDARLKLLIPVTADSGQYRSTITITVI